MNRTLLSVFLLVCSAGAIAQTIVSTSPQNKNVILEEFTGVNCQYCPDGHAIANSIKNANPNDVFIINIHQGGFATPGPGQPDFRTSFGNGIANQTGLTGYPSATVNRHVFPGLGQGTNSTAMSRNNWQNAANQILNQSSYVNVATQANLNISTRELTVLVEAYYTASSPIMTNNLHVALMQNNTRGPQTGGNQGNNYLHQHRLVHMLTGQSGVNITTTSTGSFYTQTFTYSIPEDYIGIPAMLGDFEVVAFITQNSTQEIISGHGSSVNLVGFEHENNLAITTVNPIAPTCISSVNPVVRVQNLGSNTATSFVLNYSVNGGTSQSHTWNGNLGPLQIVDVTLPTVSGFGMQQENGFTVNIATPDQVTSDNSFVEYFNRATNVTNNLTLTITTDGYAYETTWRILGLDGLAIASGSGNSYGNNTTQNISIPVATNGCYLFQIFDSYGDGSGPVTLRDSNNVVIFSSNGAYGSGASAFFEAGTLSTQEFDKLSLISLYPNPSNGLFNISAFDNILNVDVYDLVGKKVYSQSQISGDTQLNLTSLPKGVYLARILSENTQVKVQKVVIR